MNLYHRVTEVRNHIDSLQQIANKHKEKNDNRRHKIICETIEENKLHLKELNEDLKKHQRIILYRMFS